jgi:hypothetical protein
LWYPYGLSAIRIPGFDALEALAAPLHLIQERLHYRNYQQLETDRRAAQAARYGWLRLSEVELESPIGSKLP